MTWIIPVILFFDQLTKKLASKHLISKEIKIIGDYVKLVYVRNTGIAFGLFQNKAFLHGILSLIVVLVILIFKDFNHIKSKWLNFSLILISSGAMGNIIDRIRLGYVVDMIKIPIIPVFNIADSSVFIGAVMLGIYLLKNEKRRKMRGVSKWL